ncbi:MAG: hypothetical protein FD153_2096 [Rhodospirillaceae bacterium]|nr:MAG: hypothetical protein FD153_2096 [Rhodospirillaceae bacterium]
MREGLELFRKSERNTALEEHKASLQSILGGVLIGHYLRAVDGVVLDDMVCNHVPEQKQATPLGAKEAPLSVAALNAIPSEIETSKQKAEQNAKIDLLNRIRAEGVRIFAIGAQHLGLYRSGLLLSS